MELQHDPLNDVLVQIKNAEHRGKKNCEVRPASNLIGRVLKVMLTNNYISTFERVDNNRGGFYRVNLNGNINDCGVIKPRFSVKVRALEDWEARYLPGQDFGVLIMTTPSGVISNDEAKKKNTGGRLLAYVY